MTIMQYVVDDVADTREREVYGDSLVDLIKYPIERTGENYKDTKSSKV